MRAERVTPAVLEEILTWWRARDEGEMQPCLLPPDGVVAVDDDGRPVAAAWLCLIEGTPAAIVDWMVARPRIPAVVAREACRAVFEQLEGIARAKGRRMLFAAACRQSMAREIRACGFVVCARDVTHLAKPLPP